MKGLSFRNLRYMNLFVERYPSKIVQEVLTQLLWYNILLDKVSFNTREWYAKKAIENDWSCNVIVRQIENNHYERVLLIIFSKLFLIRIASLSLKY